MTSVVANYVLVPPEQSGSSCHVANNDAQAAGANRMTATVKVGCDFVGCASEGPPKVVGGTVAASIAAQPFDITVSAGQTATFSVIGAGSPTLHYQWQKNGADIGGATQPTYITPNTKPADNRSVFTVKVGNAVGTVKSDPATLTVE
jgi:hypothetical protein